MSIEVFNRYEKKYMIDDDTYRMLLEELPKHMKGDKYNKDKEFYTICNIYYDTPSDELIRRSLDKPIYKEKLRLRSYGVPNPDTNVFLEIKKKYNGLVNKRRTTLRLEDAYRFVETGNPPIDDAGYNQQVINEIKYFLHVYRELSQKVYIAYDRKAFFGVNEPDLRVTFDTNIRTRRENVKLEAGDYGDGILEAGKWLMEIKSINSMPLWLTEILNENEIKGKSFSKYGTEYTNTLKYKGELELC